MKTVTRNSEFYMMNYMKYLFCTPLESFLTPKKMAPTTSARNNVTAT